MPCLTAEAHINIILLCPPGLMTQDTVYLISCHQMAGSLIVPIYPPTSVPSRSSHQCSRQQMGMRRCGWSQVKESGVGLGGHKKPSSQIHQVLLSNKSITGQTEHTTVYSGHSKRCREKLRTVLNMCHSSTCSKEGGSGKIKGRSKSTPATFGGNQTLNRV